jgi:hypothetical protein
MTAAAVLYPTSANAACSVTTGVSPDVLSCAGNSPGGNQPGGVTADSLSIIIQPGATVHANNTSFIIGNTIGYSVFGTTLNYTQTDPFSQVSGDGSEGAQIAITHTNSAIVQNWNINGQITSTLGTGIVDIITPTTGAGTANVTMNIGPGGDITTGGDSMTFVFITGGGDTANLNWTNDGTINSGQDVLVVDHALGGGTLNIVNNHDIGVGTPVGGNAFQILSGGNLTTNITNNSTGEIITNGDTAFILAPLTTNNTTINNNGLWTSNNGLAVNATVGDDIVVNNDGPDAVMTGGVFQLSLLSGDADYHNTNGATWNFTGLSFLGSATGSSTVDNTDGSTINGFGGSSALVQAALVDATLNNLGESEIFLNTPLNIIGQLAGNDATINNTGDSDLLMGLFQNSDVNVIGQIAFNNATINNTGNSLVSQWGISNTIAQGAGNDATINNTGRRAR